jgi:hypothetical protein
MERHVRSFVGNYWLAACVAYEPGTRMMLAFSAILKTSLLILSALYSLAVTLRPADCPHGCPVDVSVSDARSLS